MVERETSSRAQRRSTSSSRWDVLSPRAGDAAPHVDFHTEHRAPSPGREEPAQRVGVTGRFDHDDTNMSPSVQPCMNPLTDEDLANFLLNNNSSAGESSSVNPWSFNAEDVNITPWQDIYVAPGEGSSGKTSSIQAAEEAITEQSFDELKLNLPNLKVGSLIYRRVNMINNIVNYIKNVFFIENYNRGKDNISCYVSPRYRLGPFSISKKYESYFSAEEKTVINKALNILNERIERVNNDLLTENIDIVADIVSNKDVKIAKLSLKKTGNSSYYSNRFAADGSLKTESYGKGFLNSVQANVKRRKKWNNMMNFLGLKQNIIPAPSNDPSNI